MRACEHSKITVALIPNTMRATSHNPLSIPIRGRESGELEVVADVDESSVGSGEGFGVLSQVIYVPRVVSSVRFISTIFLS